MSLYEKYEKPQKWLRSNAPTGRNHFIADRIMDVVIKYARVYPATTQTIRGHQFIQQTPALTTFVYDDAEVKKEAGDTVTIAMQSLKPWPGISDLKVNTNHPFAVILFDEDPSAHEPEFFEVAFFDGMGGPSPNRRSMLRTDLMSVEELKSDLVSTITDLNSDYALESKWTLATLAEQAKKDHSMSNSSLGEWEQGFIIGEAQEWTEMEPMPFANWLILPPVLQDPELQAQCDHKWRKAWIPIDVGLANISGEVIAPTKEIWVCEECDLMVDENPEAPPEDEDRPEESDELKKIEKEMRKKWEDAKKRKGGSPYDDPPWGKKTPWKDDPWKPNPYKPYQPSDDGWNKWVKHNPWMAKYNPDWEDKPHSGDYNAGASA